MRSLRKFKCVLVALSLFPPACSSEPDIRSHLGSGKEGPPRPLADDESIFLEVRGDEFDNGLNDGGYMITNVVVEIASDRTIYSKRYTLARGTEYSRPIDIMTLDQQRISDHNYTTLRRQLSPYGPAASSDPGVFFLPKECEITFGGVSQASVKVGRTFEETDGGFVYPKVCESPSGAIVRDDLNAIISSLPSLDGLGGYKID